MNKKTIIYSIKSPIKSALPVLNLWRKNHTLACGMKTTFHLIYT